jgi:hypothetical protein
VCGRVLSILCTIDALAHFPHPHTTQVWNLLRLGMMASVIGLIAAYVGCGCAVVWCVMCAVLCTLHPVPRVSHTLSHFPSGGVICIYYMFVTVKSGASRGDNYFGQTYDPMCFYTVRVLCVAVCVHCVPGVVVCAHTHPTFAQLGPAPASLNVTGDTSSWTTFDQGVCARVYIACVV